MSDCLFCKIASGEVPCDKVYEDKQFLVFLDISPVNKGHLLVIPKEHYEDLMTVPDDVLGEYFGVVKRAGEALLSGLGCDGFNVMQNNKSAAGQVIFHSHTHVIPRFEGDGFKHWKGSEYGEGETIIFKDKISQYLKK
jgi:histidine triad (HIT) family protein